MTSPEARRNIYIYISLNTFQIVLWPKMFNACASFFWGLPDSISIWGWFYRFIRYTILHLTQFKVQQLQVFNIMSQTWTLEKNPKERSKNVHSKMLILVILDTDLQVPELPRWLRIGFVGQEPVLFNTTVHENLMYGIDDSDTHINEAYVRKCLP